MGTSWRRADGGDTLGAKRGGDLPPNHPQDHRRLITFGGKTQIVHKLSRFILFPLYWITQSLTSKETLKTVEYQQQ